MSLSKIQWHLTWTCPFIDIPEFDLTCTNTWGLSHKPGVELGLSFQLLSPKSRPQPHRIIIFSPAHGASDLWAEVPAHARHHTNTAIAGCLKLAHHPLRQQLQQEFAWPSPLHPDLAFSQQLSPARRKAAQCSAVNTREGALTPPSSFPLQED